MHFDTSLSKSNTDSVSIEFKRVEYDVEKAARAVEESKFPDAYAEALKKGQ
jgi:hypothetical protein